MNPIYSIHLRLYRAQEHLDTMNELIERFLDTKPCMIWREDDPVTKSTLWCLEVFEMPPAYISVVASDAIHNMRSAMDIIMWQLVSKYKSGRPSPRTAFPLCITEESWLNVRKAIRYMPETILDLLQSVQPYFREQRGLPAQGHVFRSLHNMWNRQKHRELPQLGFVLTHTEIGHGADYETIFRDTTMFDYESVVALSVPLVEDAEPKFNPKFSFDIGFDEPADRIAMPLRESLSVIHGGVRDILVPTFTQFLY